MFVSNLAAAQMKSISHEKELFALYSVNCLRCSRLIPGLPNAYGCHSEVNSECPASEVTFVVVGKAARFAKAVKRARANGNTRREADLLVAVAKKSPAFIERFNQFLQQ